MLCSVLKTPSNIVISCLATLKTKIRSPNAGSIDVYGFEQADAADALFNVSGQVELRSDSLSSPYQQVELSLLSMPASQHPNRGDREVDDADFAITRVSQYRNRSVPGD